MRIQDSCQLLRPIQCLEGIKSRTYPDLYSPEELEVSSDCIFEDLEMAVDAAVNAQKIWNNSSKQLKQEVIAAIRSTGKCLAEFFGLIAISETGRGNYLDKVEKQILSSTKSAGLEDIRHTLEVGDSGSTVTTCSPYGVIFAVTPVTNPTATILSNTIVLISGGNGVVFNAHPGAVMCTNVTIAIMNDVIKSFGGPPCLVVGIRNTSIDSAKILFEHPKLAANLVTGGPAVVRAALLSGKKSFCAGPGNPPVVIDEGANLALAAACIYKGASFDNNMMCSDEKEVFVHEKVADRFITELRGVGAYQLTLSEVDELVAKIMKPGYQKRTHNAIVPEFVGKTPQVLASLIGKVIPDDCRLLFAEVAEDHPLVWTEQLMPVLPVTSVDSWATGCRLALAVEHGYRHTASVYTSDMKKAGEFGALMKTAIYVVNGNHLCGIGSSAEGHASFSITGLTGEGITRPSTFVRERRIVWGNHMEFG